MKSFVATLSLAAAAVAQMSSVNYTQYSDGACATVKTETKLFKVGKCHKGTIWNCLADASGSVIANATYYNEDICSSFNSSKAFDSGKCTQTGPKAARTSKIAVCF